MVVFTVDMIPFIMTLNLSENAVIFADCALCMFLTRPRKCRIRKFYVMLASYFYEVYYTKKKKKTEMDIYDIGKCCSSEKRVTV